MPQIILPRSSAECTNLNNFHTDVITLRDRQERHLVLPAHRLRPIHSDCYRINFEAFAY